MPIFTEAPKPSIVLNVAGQQNLRVVFFGTPAFAVHPLRALAGRYQVIGVVTAPDRLVGRKQVITPSPVKVAAQELGIPVVSMEDLADLKPDLCVVAAYNKILPQRILEIPRLGFLNIHPSLLPTYRGPSPVRSAILDGCTSTGVSIIKLDEEMDHGPILAQESWVIPSGLDAAACEDELFRIGSELLLRSINATGVPQDHSLATYTKKFTREDGKLDFSRPASEILNRIRALGDTPGTWTVVDGKILNILSAHLEQEKLVIDRVQPEGGKPMDWEAFLRGHPGMDNLGQ